MLYMKVETTPWRELFRSDDLTAARSVLVSIASMEFEVRLRAIGRAPREVPSRLFARDRLGNDDQSEHAPFVVEVLADDWRELADVLDQIVDEQASFDRRLERRQRERVFVAAVIMLGVAAAGGLIWSMDHASN